MSAITWEKGPAAGVWVYTAPESGPTVGIIGGIHGDERAGMEVLRQIRHNARSEPPIERGTLLLIAGNLMVAGSIRRNIPGKRSQDVNLNRSFRELTPEEAATEPERLPYEVRRGQVLRPVLDACDAALDIHEYTDPRGKPFIIGDSRASLNIGLRIGAPIIMAGWAKTEPGSTDEYMLRQGKVGLCYEAGRKDIPLESAKLGLGAAYRFMQSTETREGESEPLFEQPEFIASQRVIIRRGEDYRMLGDFHDFQILTERTAIAHDDGVDHMADAGEVVIFPPYNNEKKDIGEEICSIGQVVPDMDSLLAAVA